jgi:putative hydrolase of the HAD superfamily
MDISVDRTGAQYKSAKVKMNPKTLLENCDTLMLDMDGTVLDLAFDNYVWQELMPGKYAEQEGISEDNARAFLYSKYRSLKGKLDWYCIDHWRQQLGLDVIAIHREVNERIGFLPGARQFLETVSRWEIRLLLVTNSHRDTLALKTEVTGVAEYFDEIYTSHDVGHAKEDQPFWRALQDAELFDPERTLFIDDNISVLRSAQQFGIQKLLTVTRPDTSAPVRNESEFAGVSGVADLLL